VLLLIIASYRVDPLAAYLLIPYQIWLTFALYLNAGVWLLN
jgi:tryptophan-rich sensory protein